MAEYLIIESREPDDAFGGDDFTNWVGGLRDLGHNATVFLTQNAVIAARPGCIYNAGVQTLLEKKVKVVVDEFYATEKSIETFMQGLEGSNMDQLVDQIMSDGTRTIWH
jgi:hypothetical protein